MLTYYLIIPGYLYKHYKQGLSHQLLPFLIAIKNPSIHPFKGEKERLILLNLKYNTNTIIPLQGRRKLLNIIENGYLCLYN